MLHTFRITYLALLLIAPVAIAKPTRPPAAPKAQAKTPRQVSIDRLKLLAKDGGLTNWGTLDLGNPSFAISGHPSWEALATVRGDGKVQISWTATSSGDLYIGVYAVEADGSMAGAYGLATSVSVGTNGELVGPATPERIVRVVPPMGPDF